MEDPLVDLDLFRIGEFTVMVVAGTIGNVAIVVGIFISMIYLQTERGFSRSKPEWRSLPSPQAWRSQRSYRARLEHFPPGG